MLFTKPFKKNLLKEQLPHLTISLFQLYNSKYTSFSNFIKEAKACMRSGEAGSYVQCSIKKSTADNLV